MSEAALRGQWAKLKAFGLVQRIESPIEPGIPDTCNLLRPYSGVYYGRAITSWIELKFEDGWPRRASTRFKFESYKKEQMLWLEGWWKAGGLSGLMGQVGDDYLLFDGTYCRAVWEGRTQADLLANAVVRASRTFPLSRVLKFLTTER